MVFTEQVLIKLVKGENDPASRQSFPKDEEQ